MVKILLLLLLANNALADYAQYPPASGGGGGGAVSSVFGRTGAVTASGADYSAFYLLQRVTNSVTGNFTVPTLTTEYILNANTTGGAIVITLPSAITSDKFCIKIKNTGSPANNLTVNTVLAQTIDGGANFILTDANQANEFCAISNNWFIY